MKFTLVKLSALALVAASMVSAEESQPKLRDAKKNLPELRGAIQVGAEQDVALSDESSDVSSEMPSNESSLESSFLPDEMNEEERNNDDDDDDDGGFEDHTPPDYEQPPAAAIPSPVKSSANNVGRDAMVKSSAKEGGRDTADGETNDDDETVDVPFPSPVKNSANNRGRVTTDGKKSPNPSEDANAESWEKPSSPDRSTADQSTCSFEGLRTQPTTQQLSPKLKAPNAKKSATAKFSLMGTVFENQKKKDQPAKKKSGGLYIPTYSRK
mmetsp:Transcript_26638/g.48008  ORF Transcript_26638/g.48008 Transcript_26638/m.48008 type:complete len:269 (-) Transcript_26638:117-923(-)